MKTRSKTVIIIIATLIIGIVLGVVGGGMFFKYFANRIANKPIPNRFTSFVERIIKPDENQVDSVRAILNKYGERMSVLDQQHIAVITNLMDSMHTDLSTVLTEEQMSRLDEHQKRAQRFFKGRKPFPRTPGGPGMRGKDGEPPPGFDMQDHDKEPPLESGKRNEDKERPKHRDRI